MESKYYIYFHVDPRDNMPKYVGKGSGKRAWEFGKSRRNLKHSRWVKKLESKGLEPIVIIGNRFESEEECFKAEIADIAFFRKLGIDLKNITNGGDGVRLTKKDILKRSEKFKKPIVCLNNNKIYSSTKDCSIELGIDTRRINDVLKARKNSYKGYKFKYLDENNNKIPDKIRKQKYLSKKYTTGKKVIREIDGHIYPTFSDMSKSIDISLSYISKKFKKSDTITIRNIKYRKAGTWR